MNVLIENLRAFREFVAQKYMNEHKNPKMNQGNDYPLKKGG